MPGRLKLNIRGLDIRSLDIRGLGYFLARHSLMRHSLRRSFSSGFKVFTCSILVMQPVMVDMAVAQEIILDPSGNVGSSVSISRPTNKAPVVNIAKPNSGGVSKNKFTKYNVGQKGVVLNNSRTGGSSQLNGSVAGNANLSGGSADTIINEVSSTYPSQINGATEVAGQRASVIIANPNGIGCDGCTFINTREATLTTGRTVVDGGSLVWMLRRARCLLGAVVWMARVLML